MFSDEDQAIQKEKSYQYAKIVKAVKAELVSKASQLTGSELDAHKAKFNADWTIEECKRRFASWQESKKTATPKAPSTIPK